MGGAVEKQLSRFGELPTISLLDRQGKIFSIDDPAVKVSVSSQFDSLGGWLVHAPVADVERMRQCVVNSSETILLCRVDSK